MQELFLLYRTNNIIFFPTNENPSINLVVFFLVLVKLWYTNKVNNTLKGYKE